MNLLLSLLVPMAGCVVTLRVALLSPLPFLLRIGAVAISIFTFLAWTGFAHASASWDLVALRGRLARMAGQSISACPMGGGWGASAWEVGWCLQESGVRPGVRTGEIFGLILTAGGGWMFVSQGVLGAGSLADVLLVGGLAWATTRQL